ncbi:hypothetical protein KW790_02820 [Candidatus Parcubacteria bacterium]|nr:hypothetical protein [Candidatus Parcubacteria bacterium]
MEKITPQSLRETEDWRDLYLENGQAMLDEAETLLKSDDPDHIELGLKIVAEAYFEEDEENPDVPPSLSHLNFDDLMAPLKKLIDNPLYKEKALHCLKVIALEKGEREAPDLEKALKNLTAGGDNQPHQAVSELLYIMKHGGDISPALPIIFKHEEKLSMATDAMQLVATYYINNKKYDELRALLSRDEAGAIRIYRGLSASAAEGVNLSDFLKSHGVEPLLAKIEATGKVITISSVLAGEV